MPDSATQRTEQRSDIEESATLRTLNSFAVDLISIPNTEDLFWYVARNVVGRLKFQDCVIYQANEEQTVLTQVAALGEKNPFGRSIVNPLKIAFGHGITGQAAQSHEAIIVDDLLKDQSYIEDTQRARSEICVPIICGNRVVGVIDSEHPDPNAFGPAELEILTTIAAMTSAKLDLLAEAERSKQRYHDLVAAHVQLSDEVASRKALEAELFAARKFEAVGRLTGRFAHEFNNFLTVISGNLELLEAAINDSPFTEILQDAQSAATRGATLIQSMLTYSQRARLSLEQLDLNAEITTALAQEARGPSGPVSITLAKDLNPINTDRKVLNTVLLHLFSNARDAMPDGGDLRITTEAITHTLADDRALVTPLAPGRYVCLSIQDTGVGMSAEEVQQVFDPFHTTKPIGTGLGLGLSMTLGFVQQSGGTMAVQSVAGEGSVFRLYFPESPPRRNDLLTTGH